MNEKSIKSLQVATVAVALNLRPPDASVEATGRRRTGRTTRMLLRATTDALEGHQVRIVAEGYAYATQLSNQVREWLRRLDGDTDLVLRPISSAKEYELREQNQWRFVHGRIFYDHFCDHERHYRNWTARRESASA